MSALKIYHGLGDKRLKPRARSVAIGVFDGVHRGHRAILSGAIQAAKRRGLSPMVVTFHPHPQAVLRMEKRPAILLSLPHRLRLFEEIGVREVVLVRFNKAFSRIPHEIFLKKLHRIGMRALCVGSDFRFGCGGKGDAAYLKRAASTGNFALRLVRPLKDQKDTISSTHIRKLIEKGELEKAGRMLGRPVSVYGTVVHGRGRGKKIGFPTANLNPHHETLPPAGVYAAWGRLGRRKLKGLIHIGRRPTFKDRQSSLEVHLLGFHEDIYGRDIELLFVRKLRDIIPFRTPAELSAAIRRDAVRARRILA